MSDSLRPMDYTVHGILQARILEWVAVPFAGGSFQSRNQTQVSRIADRFFTNWTTRNPEVFSEGPNPTWTFPGDASGNEPTWEGPLENKMATHSSILSWEIPQTEEPGRLQSQNLDTT